ncbi:DUF4158 domain-containing protein [Kitasatospora sp. NPDC127116]|uniref:DUF4158 domain-containing protein n=1 Tax=Kitasatospora sp. NPDC127116 TaxID=3345367 RepID=UPI0036412DB2
MGTTSIERTAYPRFKRLVSAHELHLFFAPTREEAARAAERMDADGDQPALLLALKSYQRMGRFPRPEEYPEARLRPSIVQRASSGRSVGLSAARPASCR